MSFDTKTCKKCGLEKDLAAFSLYGRKNGAPLHRNICRECIKPSRKKYYENNKNSILEDHKEYYQSNRETVIDKVKKYASDHIEEKKQYNKSYYQANKKNIQIKVNLCRNERKKIDPAYKLREDISTIIRRTLRSAGSSKYGKSIKKYLPYSIQELKNHLEQQFESWMTWDNWSKYDPKTWDNNDTSTWTWQLDHIIPQSNLPYTSMDSDNFNKCWSLSNLRPLSSKQNLLDGVNRTRHGGRNVI